LEASYVYVLHGIELAEHSEAIQFLLCASLGYQEIRDNYLTPDRRVVRLQNSYSRRADYPTAVKSTDRNWPVVEVKEDGPSLKEATLSSG